MSRLAVRVPEAGTRHGLAVAAGQACARRRSSASAFDPDPEVPNEQVAKILKDLFGDRPIRRGQVMLDMPVVAEDGARRAGDHRGA